MPEKSIPAIGAVFAEVNVPEAYRLVAEKALERIVFNKSNRDEVDILTVLHNDFYI